MQQTIDRILHEVTSYYLQPLGLDSLSGAETITLSQPTNALAESGTDPETSETRELVGNCGFTWALGKSRGRTGETVATRALVNAYRLLGGAAFTRMLQLLWDAWEGDPRSLTASILSGMALFVKTYETEMNDSTFAKRLSQAGPDETNRRGRADFSASNARSVLPVSYWRNITGRGAEGSCLTGLRDEPVPVIFGSEAGIVTFRQAGIS